MTDLSDYVPWMLVLVGVPLSVVIGLVTRGPRSTGRIIGSVVLALGLCLALCFGAAVLHGECIERHYCESRGDGNLSYWFGPLLALPLYWFMILIPGQRNRSGAE